MIRREISNTLLKYSKEYPVVTITGPRQAGKTTLARMTFPDKLYVSLEDIEIRNYAITDPKAFLSHYSNASNGVIIDEIQYVPDLLSYIQLYVDEEKKPGRYILTGSQNFHLLNNISQSLAGRTALVTLLPLSLDELKYFYHEITIDDILYSGFYPGIHNEKLNPTEAISFYVATYIERDLRQLLNVKNLSQFTTFLKICAGRTGQILNLSSVGNDVGINHNTARNWISILEASYIVKLVRPYYRNINKRLIKSPKLYFIDTGIASFLIGIQNKDQLFSHPLRGALFETFVYSEILKNRFNRGRTDNIYFFRDRKGNEVDFILDYGTSIKQIETKSAQTIANDFFKNLKYTENIFKNISASYIIYGGNIPRFQNNTSIVSWKDLNKLDF